MAKQMLPLADNLVRCTLTINRRSSAESGLVAQAMAAAARAYLQEHLLVVLQLEDRASSTRNRLSLQVNP